MKRTRAYLGLAGLLGLGALAAGLADGWPESVRAVGALVLVLALPALLVRPLVPDLSRGSRRNTGLYIPLSFLLWLSMIAAWTTVFTVAHASFRVYAVASIWALMAFYAVCALHGWWRGAGLGVPTGRAWWIVLAACALFAALNPPRLSVGEDGLDHVGYVRHVLTENSLSPAGVLAPVAGESSLPEDPRKGALHPVLAFSSWVASADPPVVWRWLPLILFPVAALSLIALNDVFLGSSPARVVSAALALLTFDGNPFRFAAASPHGESVAAMWCWVLVASAVAAPAGGMRPWHWLVLAAGGVLVHMGVAWHVLILGATIAVFGGGWDVPRRERAARCAWLVSGALLGLLLRYNDIGGVTNEIHAHTQGVMFVSKGLFIASPMEILRLHGLVVLGGLVCVPVLAVSRRRDARRVLAAAAVPFAVSFVPWIATWLHAHGSYMVFRSLLQVPAFAAIGIAGSMLAAGVRARDRRAMIMGVPAAALWLLVFAGPVPGALARDVHSRMAGEPRAPEIAMGDLVRIVAALPSDAVILADPATSYALSARTSQRYVAVYGQHGNPRDPHAMDRIRSVRDTLSPYFVAEAASAACRRFHVDYVVVNAMPPAGAGDFLQVWDAGMYTRSRQRLRSMTPAFSLVDTTAHAAVYRFDPGTGLGLAWTPRNQPVTAGGTVLHGCEVEAPGGAYRVTGVSLDRARVLPGDTVEVTVGYRRDAPMPFSLPTVVHVRFDHADVHASPSFAGEKQWRRTLERRAGTTTRFRQDLLPGHGVYDPDLWPVGYDLSEKFRMAVPRHARTGEYTVEVSIARQTLVPNFHVRDLFFNRDHYSGRPCASLAVVDRLVGTEGAP